MLLLWGWWPPRPRPSSSASSPGKLLAWECWEKVGLFWTEGELPGGTMMRPVGVLHLQQGPMHT